MVSDAVSPLLSFLECIFEVSPVDQGKESRDDYFLSGVLLWQLDISVFINVTLMSSTITVT